MPKNGQKPPSLKKSQFLANFKLFSRYNKKNQDIEMKDHKILYNGKI